MACVDLPAFPLQLLIRRHPDWARYPAAVVDKDKPQGILLWVNERARECRILPGLRYAAGLSLSRELRAGVVSRSEIEEEISRLTRRIRFYTPDVEPSESEPGVFWLGAAGLELLHPSLQGWAGLIQEDLARAGLSGQVAVGFSRFGTYAASKAASGADTIPGAGITVFRDAEEERTLVRRIPIDRLGFVPELRDTLVKLGIDRLGGFLDLPPEGVQRRFGPEAWQLHRLARGDLWSPLRPEKAEEPIEEKRILDHPESDLDRLMAVIEEALSPLLRALQERNRALSALLVRLVFDRPAPTGRPTRAGRRAATGRSARAEQPARAARRAPTGHAGNVARAGHIDGPGDARLAGGTGRPGDTDRSWNGARTERLCPARPTLDRAQILQLVRLRLESAALDSGVVEIRLEAEAVAGTREQVQLFDRRPRRDLAAANRALARLRAEFGEHSVVKACAREAHLPEASFAWEPLETLKESNPRKVVLRPLARRIFARPIGLPPRLRHEPDGWLISGVEGGAVEETIGPYIVSGGWWRKPAHREYHFVRTRQGRWLWVYYDRERRRWFQHGEVE